MRIHSNVLTTKDLCEAVALVPGANGDWSEHGSRRKQRALEFKLYADEPGPYRRRGNSGRYGSDSYGYALAWDEWGIILAELFARDPHAVIPRVYEDAVHYHWVTGARFLMGAKPPVHGHKWDIGMPTSRGYSVAQCKGRERFDCTAVLRWTTWGHTFEEVA